MLTRIIQSSYRCARTITLWPGQSSGIRAHRNTARGTCKSYGFKGVPLLLGALGSLRSPRKNGRSDKRPEFTYLGGCWCYIRGSYKNDTFIVWDIYQQKLFDFDLCGLCLSPPPPFKVAFPNIAIANISEPSLVGGL